MKKSKNFLVTEENFSIIDTDNYIGLLDSINEL